MFPGPLQEEDIVKAARSSDVRLRILATSDLHMQITAFDYVNDRPTTGGSLAKLATLIKTARAEASRDNAACLLFDNGDTFQGTPMGDLLAHEPDAMPHPMVACMTHLGYDAGGLGNHDFDHGLKPLGRTLSQHQMPIVCSNLKAASLPMVRSRHILDCATTTVSGTPENLRIGILSSLPRKTALWSRHQVGDRTEFLAPLPALRGQAAALRADGADFIIALAHMGLALFDEGEDAQNLISEVAAIEDIDVVIGGHTHLRFPGPDHASLPEADCEYGIVHGTPVVQPGASASDLAVIDLDLQKSQRSSGWKIRAAEVALRPVCPDTPEASEIVEIARPMHEKTRHHLSQPVARLSKPMNTYFALAHPSPVPALLAAAKLRTVKAAIAGTSHADIPLLTVASAPLTGGYDGPDNFLHLPGGQVKRQHVAGLNPYANHVWAVRTTGAQLRDWLERSALIFNLLHEEDENQMLIDPRVPGFHFDTIYGLTYTIDPRIGPSFGSTGRRLTDQPGRIRDIRWQGAPLRDDQEFLVATTDHRAGGGGLYKPFNSTDIVVRGNTLVQDAVLDYLKDADCLEVRSATPWRFAPQMNCRATLLTAPEALAHLDDIAHLKPEARGETENGFLRVRLSL